MQETLNYITSEIHKSYSPLFKPDVLPAVREERLAYLKMRYALIEKQLEGRKYLFGERFTVADAYLFTLTRWARGVKLDLAAFPNLEASRSAWAAARLLAGVARGGADPGQQGRVNYRLNAHRRTGPWGPVFGARKESRMPLIRMFVPVCPLPSACRLGLPSRRTPRRPASRCRRRPSRRRPTASTSSAATRWSRCATA